MKDEKDEQQKFGEDEREVIDLRKEEE